MYKKENQTLTPQKIKDLWEFVHKSPEFIALQQQCKEIGEGKRKEISEKLIDDAFDALGIIVKNLSDTPEEELNLQKLSAKYLFSLIIKSRNIRITD